MESSEQNEPTSFFVVPEQNIPEPGLSLDDTQYNRWNKRDEKIADIHAELASKTKILPEQVDHQRKLLFENAVTKHWTPLSNKDTRRFGAPSAQTEQAFEKAVASELEREKEVMRKQGLRDDQIASKMDEREQQARERLAKSDKAFFGIRDKPFEVQKAKSNEALMQEARASYDEAEQKFKSKLNKLLDDANERTNDEARTAKIQLEKARKNLVQAFTGEDDPELVKKYNEILQMSNTRQEAEKKIFEYKLDPSISARSGRLSSTPRESIPSKIPDTQPRSNVEASDPDSYLIPEPRDQYDEDDIYFSPNGTMGHFILAVPGSYVWESLSDYHEDSDKLDNLDASLFDSTPSTSPVEGDLPKEKEVELHTYEYFVVHAKHERDALTVAVEQYLLAAKNTQDTETLEHAYDRVRRNMDSILQLRNMDVVDVSDKVKYRTLVTRYEALVNDVDRLINPSTMAYQNAEEFWSEFEFNDFRIAETVDASIDDFYKPWLNDINYGEQKNIDDGLSAAGERLASIVPDSEQLAKEKQVITDQTVDRFIEDNMINASALVAAYEAYLKNPTERNKDKLLFQVDEVGAQFKKLPDFDGFVFKGSQEPTNPIEVPSDGSPMVLPESEKAFREGLQKYKGFINYKQDIRILLNYSLEATGATQSQLAMDLEAQDEVVMEKLEGQPENIRNEYLENLNQERANSSVNISEFRKKIIQDLADDLNRARGKDVPLKQEPFNAKAFSERFPSNSRPKEEQQTYRPYESKDNQVVKLSGDALDTFIDDHMVDVSKLQSEYQSYRDSQKALSAFRKSAQNGNVVPSQEIEDLEKSLTASRETLNRLVAEVDEQLRSGKGVDKNVTLEVMNDSAQSGNAQGSRESSKLFSLLSYQKEVSELLELAEEATGKKKNKKGNQIHRSEADVQELFRHIDQNLQRLQNPELPVPSSDVMPEPLATSPAENVETQSRPLNSHELPTKIAEINQLISQIDDSFYNARYIGSRQPNEAEIGAIETSYKKLHDYITNGQLAGVPYPLSQSAKDIERAALNLKGKLYENQPLNDTDELSDLLSSLYDYKDKGEELVFQSYVDQIHEAIEASTPDVRKKVEIPVDVFAELTSGRMTSYSYDVQESLQAENQVVYEEYLDILSQQRYRLDDSKLLFENTNVQGSSPDVARYLDALQALIKVTEEGEKELRSNQSSQEVKQLLIDNIQDQRHRLNSLARIISVSTLVR